MIDDERKAELAVFSKVETYVLLAAKWSQASENIHSMEWYIHHIGSEIEYWYEENSESNDEAAHSNDASNLIFAPNLIDAAKIEGIEAVNDAASSGDEDAANSGNTNDVTAGVR